MKVNNLFYNYPILLNIIKFMEQVYNNQEALENTEKFFKDQEVSFIDGSGGNGSGEKMLKTGKVSQIMRDNISVLIDGTNIALNVPREKLYDKSVMQQLLADKDTLGILAKHLEGDAE